MRVHVVTCTEFVEMFYDKFLGRLLAVIPADRTINPKCVVP